MALENTQILELSRKLTEVLERITGLEVERDEIIAALVPGGTYTPGAKSTQETPEPTQPAKPKRQTKAQKTAAAVEKVLDQPAPAPVDYPDEAKKFDDAMSGYDFDINKASVSQGKMIFAILQSDYGLSDDQAKKGVIRGYVNKYLNPEQPLGSTKQLTKIQAGALIDWLQSDEPTPEEIDALINEFAEPF